MRSPNKARAIEIIKERQIEFETILDVGVLTGTPELIAGFPHKRHILFEPVAEFRDAIAASYREIDYRLVNAAVSDTDGTVDLRTMSIIEGVDISHSSIVSADGTQASATGIRKVPSIKIDSFLRDENLQGEFLLKVDVDGFELAVLRGAEASLPRIPIAIVEVPLEEFTPRIQWLEQRGYVLFDLAEPCYYDDAFWQADAIMIKRELRESKFKDIHKSFDLKLYSTFRG
jgi:FkbM family methyltransferase